ncbi:MAG: hypothetical protein WCY34_04760, partial [Candidatus Omnitrophota bacterium]
FRAKVIDEASLRCVQLNRIYRQKDKEFIDLLGKIRLNECRQEDIDFLNERVGLADDSGYITLTTTNRDAESMNRSCLQELDSREYQYQAQVTGDFKSSLHPTEMTLSLKRGAKVILLNNDKDKRWVNGTIAEIAELTDDSIRIEVGNEIHILERFVWEKIKYAFDDDTREIKEEVAGEFKQYPLRLAWAITIHKSQGQTFEKVIIDIGWGAFSPGQVYVALSRCVSLEGVVLKRPISMRDVITDDEMRNFQAINSFDI